MADFVWTISADRQSGIGVNGVSGSYIIPRAEMKAFDHQLNGKHLYIVLRGQQDRCIAAIRIKRVERFLEGLNTGDFLIYTDISKSIRFCSTYEEAKPYALPSNNKLGLGVEAINNDLIKIIKLALSANINIKFTLPTGIPDNTSKLSFDNDNENALFAVSFIVQKMNLNQMWGSGTGLKLNPVANFAKQILSKNNDPLSDTLLALLKSINPIESILVSTLSTIGDSKPGKRKKFVDLSFTVIVPDNIFAREFISGEGTFYDLESALNKTDIAEKLHQSILRDISEFLKSVGVIPFESTSIDLLIQRNSSLRIFEIKSVNQDNLIAQSAKGSFQIATYATALEKESKKVSAYLIINKSQDEQLESFVLDSLNYLGINCLIYNSEIPWPNRLPGLLD